MVNGELVIQKVQQADSGMYQCVAENKYGAIYSSAELKILGIYPLFVDYIWHITFTFIISVQTDLEKYLTQKPDMSYFVCVCYYLGVYQVDRMKCKK